MSQGKDYAPDGVKKRKRNTQTILLPAMGFILVLAAAAIAYVLSEPAFNFVQGQIANIPSLDQQPELQIAAGAAIFFIMLMFYALLFTVFAPKPPKGITERELDKEKKDRIQEQMRADRRKKQMRNKMRQQNRDDR